MSGEPKSNPGPDFCSPARAVQAFAPLEGRWKMAILYHLFAQGTLRFSELERLIPKVSQRMLTVQLRALERDQIISRQIYPEVPPRVEYTITPSGYKLRPILHALLEWADSRQAPCAE